MFKVLHQIARQHVDVGPLVVRIMDIAVLNMDIVS